MLTARRLLERRAAEAARAALRSPSLPTQPPQLSDAEILQARFRAKQEAARAPAKAEAPAPAPAPVTPEPAPVSPDPVAPSDDKVEVRSPARSGSPAKPSK